MSSTQCKDTKSYEHVNEHTTGRNILTENYHTQQENADSINIFDIPIPFCHNLYLSAIFNRICRYRNCRPYCLYVKAARAI
jgi:hypothetical protein